MFRCMSTFLLQPCVRQSAEGRTVRTTQLKGALRCGLYPVTWHGNYRTGTCHRHHGAPRSRACSHTGFRFPCARAIIACVKNPGVTDRPCDFRSRRVGDIFWRVRFLHASMGMPCMGLRVWASCQSQPSISGLHGPVKSSCPSVPVSPDLKRNTKGLGCTLCRLDYF